ncbi:MAG: hypothetical protein ACOC32_01410 [Nanoarchaeota archaeon]
MIFALVASGTAFSQDVEGVPQLGVLNQVFVHLFGLEGSETVGVLIVDEPVGERDPAVWGRAAENPTVQSLVFVFDREQGEYRYASYSPEADVKLKPHSQQPYPYSEMGFEEYADDVEWLDLTEQYVMFDVQPFSVFSGYYADLTNEWEELEAARVAAEERFAGAMAARQQAVAELEQARQELAAAKANADADEQRISELEAAEQEAAENLQTTEEDLLMTLSEKEAAETKVEELQAMIREKNALIAELEGQVEDLEGQVENRDAEIARLQDELAASKALEDPYKVRMMNLDREGLNPFVSFTGIGEANYDNYNDDGWQDLIGRAQAEGGMVYTNDETGLVYFLTSAKAEYNSDNEWGVEPRVIISMPYELIRAKVQASFGTAGLDSEIYRGGTDDEVVASIIPALELNLVGEEARFSVEGSLEASATDNATAWKVAGSFEYSPTHVPWVTFAVREVSYTVLEIEDADSERFRAQVGGYLNFFRDVEEDPWEDQFFRLGVFYDYNIEQLNNPDKAFDTYGLQLRLEINPRDFLR